jgi:hypothetical protein
MRAFRKGTVSLPANATIHAKRRIAEGGEESREKRRVHLSGVQAVVSATAFTPSEG